MNFCWVNFLLMLLLLLFYVVLLEVFHNYCKLFYKQNNMLHILVLLASIWNWVYVNNNIKWKPTIQAFSKYCLKNVWKNLKKLKQQKVFHCFVFLMHHNLKYNHENKKYMMWVKREINVNNIKLQKMASIK